MKRASLELILGGPSHGRLLNRFLEDAYLERCQELSSEQQEAFLMLQVNALAGRNYIIQFRGEAVGFVSVYFFFSTRYAGRCARVEELFVQSERRMDCSVDRILSLLLMELETFGIVAVEFAMSPANPLTFALLEQGFEERPLVLFERFLGLDEDWD